MAELIATIVLFSGLIGMGAILFRKILVLVQLPETPTGPGFRDKILKIARKFRNLKFFKIFKISSSEILLQKILSKIKILTLKMEGKTECWLQKLRKKSQTKTENDQYWQKIKKSISEKKPTDKKK